MEHYNISNLLKQELESIGAEILGVSDRETTKIVIVGCLPQIACVFTVNVIFGKSSKEGNRYKFTINGQVRSPEVIALRIRSAGWFPDISRCAQEDDEHYGEKAFGIYHHEQNILGVSDEDKIKTGTEFFRNFLDGYKDVLDKQFTEEVFFSSSTINMFPEELFREKSLISTETRK